MTNAAIGLAILGGGGGAGGPSGVSSLALFKQYQKDQVKARQRFLDRGDVQKELETFKKRVGRLENVEDIVKDRRVFEFVLTAFGLEAEVNNPGKMRAVIESDPDDINSFANRLTDPRYGELNKFLHTKQFGVKKLTMSSTQNELVTKYLTNQFEKIQGQQSPQMRDALFFLRTINGVQSTAEILGNMPLRNIVTTALNLPAQMARQSVDKQISLIDAKFDLSKARLNNTEEGVRTAAEILQDDINAVSAARSLVGEALSVVSGLESRIETYRTTLQDLPNITDPSGVNADEITLQEGIIDDLLRQKGLLAAADTGIISTREILSEMDALFTSARNAADQDELDLVKSDFQRLVDKITGNTGTINSATYNDPQTGNSENLLRSGGDAGAGIDAMSSTSVTTVVKSDGTAAVSQASDLSSFLTDIASVNTSFQAISFGNLSNDVNAVETSFDAAEDDFEVVEFQNTVNQSAFNSSLGSVAFAKALNSQNITGGLLAIDDALTRSTTAQSILDDMRELAKEAQGDGADLTDINARYDSLLNQLTDAFNTPGSSTDGTSTITYDNLLADGSFSYDVSGGNLITANGFDLDTTILANLPTDITLANAAALQTSIDDTYKPEMEDVVNQLNSDRPVFDFASSTMDPYGTVDAQIKKIGDDLDTLIASAERDGKNLLDEFESDVKFKLDSLVTTLTLSPETSFESDIRTAIDKFNFTVLNSGSQSDRETALNDVLYTVSGVVSRLKGEDFALSLQSEILKSEQTLNEEDAESGFLTPLENSAYAVKFIEQYLVRKDALAAGANFGPTNGNAALVGLVQQIAPSSGLNLNLFT